MVSISSYIIKTFAFLNLLNIRLHDFMIIQNYSLKMIIQNYKIPFFILHGHTFSDKDLH